MQASDEREHGERREQDRGEARRQQLDPDVALHGLGLVDRDRGVELVHRRHQVERGAVGIERRLRHQGHEVGLALVERQVDERRAAPRRALRTFDVAGDADHLVGAARRRTRRACRRRSPPGQNRRASSSLTIATRGLSGRSSSRSKPRPSRMRTPAAAKNPVVGLGAIDRVAGTVGRRLDAVGVDLAVLGAERVEVQVVDHARPPRRRGSRERAPRLVRAICRAASAS